jgi:mRNA interferase YafQ
MRRVVLTTRFKQAYRRYTRRNVRLRAQVDDVILQMAADVFRPSLRTHVLSGELSGWLACSCGRDCRILFVISQDEETGGEKLVLLDIGTHDEVY